MDQTQNETNQNVSYLPFGGGPGKCISETFASFENVVVAIEMLIRRFNFQTAPGAPSVVLSATTIPIFSQYRSMISKLN
ncbi:hypothetical protein HID58_066414 [Brassica napus]|uniref:BnaA09g24950D protein n=2 Tax=Brassica napus TaxID=3708 RepID=A0A078FD40_BRANA|nr:hypothetical protein HID58_066414 [Brassica napus]CAF1929089.1 unnamed protein product [Brassica napus]CDY12295.1 BnaA09g24950D [Brassica napus]